MSDPGSVEAETGLAEPPDDPVELATFPDARPVGRLHRLSDHPGVWYYHGVDDLDRDRGGRFDLETPAGTCHTAESLDGAVVEKLLRTRVRVVVAERLGELFHATVAVRDFPRCADLTARAATRWGVDAEIHSTLRYGLTRRWARAFHRAGRRALRHLLRGDPTGELAGVALFGKAGLHRRAPSGMTTDVRPLERAAAERSLADRGVEVRPIPTEVPIVAPPLEPPEG